MSRIIIDTRTSGGNLAEMFVRALGLLHDAQIEIRPGTKLLTKYAVVIADDEATDRALSILHGASVVASKEGS
jgi:hypothetical protein